MRSLYPLVFFVFLSPLVSWGQEIEFSISSNQIHTGDVLELYVNVRDFHNFLVPPSFPTVPGLRDGGQASRNSFGHFSGPTYTFIQTYIPEHEGEFVVPSFTYRVDDKFERSPEFKVKVIPGSSSKTQLGPASYDPAEAPLQELFQKNPFEKFRSYPGEQLVFKEVEADYFLAMNLNKESYYVGEEVFCEVMLYVRPEDKDKILFDLQDIRNLGLRIYNEHFWEEPLDVNGIPMGEAVVKGQKYITYAVYRSILFPLHPGRIRFEDIYLDARKLFVAENPGSPEKDLVGKWKNIKIYASDREIEVSSLPPTELPEASSVGQFAMYVPPPPKSVETGHPLQLKVILRGKGNVSALPAPYTQFDSTFQLLEERSGFEVLKTRNAMDGKKEFFYKLIPSQPGFYNLGPIRFFYFNPEKANYDTLEVKDYIVSVTGDPMNPKLLSYSSLGNFYPPILESSSDRPAGNFQWIKLWLVLALVSTGGVYAFSRILPKIKKRA